MIAADTPAVAGYGTASPKIQPGHRDRWAIVYVRQSSPQQVLEHRESTALQYALRERAIAWGWPAERVRIMDQDQGITATTADGRGGFQELLAEIALDHVGLILGFQMSRLSRRCVDWHQLLELCALFDVLLGDTDGLYDLRDYNDRLLLGIKGTLSPLYAGAYTWGRRAVNPRKKVPGRSGTGRTVVAPEHCQVFLPERSPAYIPWEQYQANRKQLADNQQRAAARGSPRDGPALVGGLVVCGTCGRRMTVQYQSGAHFRYACTRNVSDYAGPVCQSLRGDGLDELVGRLVLAALEPAALELSLAAQADVERERQRLEEHWRQRLERSRYDAERAARQYHAVEPENRLVARELERRWEGTLLEQRKVEEEHDRFQRQQPAALSEGEREDSAGPGRRPARAVARGRVERGGAEDGRAAPDRAYGGDGAGRSRDGPGAGAVGGRLSLAARVGPSGGAVRAVAGLRDAPAAGRRAAGEQTYVKANCLTIK